MERERQNASRSVARERACAAAAERDAEAASSQADARKRQLQHELDNAHSEVTLLIFGSSALARQCLYMHLCHGCFTDNLYIAEIYVGPFYIYILYLVHTNVHLTQLCRWCSMHRIFAF